MRWICTAACLMGALTASSVAFADTLHVPSQYETIKGALAEAVDGDLVLIGPGHYEEDGLVIKQGVEVVGAGAAYTEIWAGEETPSVTFEADGALTGVWIHGGQPAIAFAGDTISIWIDGVWIGPSLQTISGHVTGASEVGVVRSVFWAEGQGFGLEYDAASWVQLGNNHFMGAGGEWLVSLFPTGAGGDSGGTTLVHNNIFENAAVGLDLAADAVISGHDGYVVNNIYIANDLGVDLSCGNLPDNSVGLNFFNNWFVDQGVGLDLSTCPTAGPGIEHHNGYHANNTDVLGIDDIAESSVHGAPQFQLAIPNDQHDDDYHLLPSSPGVDAGFGVPSGPEEYMDLDGSVPDVGAYGGPAANEWNWDGDPVPEVDGDCDDRDPARFPGNEEICDGADNDCNGVVEDDLDEDGDGVTICDGDCDDSDPDVLPGTEEDCEDGVDNDCDGDVDDADDECGGGDDDNSDDDAADDDAADDDASDDNPSGFRCECHLGGAPVTGPVAVLILGAAVLALRRRR